MNTWLLIVVMVLLVSCSLSSKMISTSDDLGGESNRPRSGVVRYDADATFSGMQKEDARTKMKEFCAPLKYRVVKLDQSQSFSSTFYQGSGGGSTSTMIFVAFECVGQITAEEQEQFNRKRDEEEARGWGPCHLKSPNYDKLACE